jgi:hypothetical protein
VVATEQRLKQYRDQYGSVAAVLAAGGALAVNQVIALLWARPRPFTAHPTVHVLLPRSTDPSFASDHAAAAFAIATVAILVRPRLGVAAVVLACLIAYARVYVGAHYPATCSAAAGGHCRRHRAGEAVGGDPAKADGRVRLHPDPAAIDTDYSLMEDTSGLRRELVLGRLG